MNPGISHINCVPSLPICGLQQLLAESTPAKLASLLAPQITRFKQQLLALMLDFELLSPGGSSLVQARPGFSTAKISK